MFASSTVVESGTTSIVSGSTETALSLSANLCMIVRQISSKVSDDNNAAGLKESKTVSLQGKKRSE